MGIWAANRLAQMLGKRVPLSDLASKLEQLIESVPSSLFHYAQQPTTALTVRMVPAKPTFAPYERILFELEITNNSAIPLGIDRDGPIRAYVAVAPSIRSADAPAVGALQPCVISIAQRFRIMPRETLRIHADLRHYPPGDVLDALCVNGGIIRSTVIPNFAVTGQGMVEPSILGSESEAPMMRVDGVRINQAWIEETVIAMGNPNAEGVIERMALLSHKISPPLRQAAPEERALIQSTRTAFDEAFAKLDGRAQAWLLGAMPAGFGPRLEGMQNVLNMARKSDHRLVRMAYLLYHAAGPNDPMFDAAIRGDDADVRRLAEVVQARIRAAVEAKPQTK
jgi:hypothetical protein